MKKIANSAELQNELRQLVAYSKTERPSRVRLGKALQELSERVAGERVATTVANRSLEDASASINKLHYTVSRQLDTTFKEAAQNLKTLNTAMSNSFQKKVMDKLDIVVKDLTEAQQGMDAFFREYLKIYW